MILLYGPLSWFAHPFRSHCSTSNTKTEISCTDALSAFMRAPLLREAYNLFLGDINILLHLLLNSPERNIVVDRLEHALPKPEAEALKKA